MASGKRDFEGAYKLVHEHLQQLDKNLFYHGIHHTFRDVVPAAEEIAKAEGCTEEEIILVKTAALFHDTGFLDQYDKNEPFGVARARKYLPDFGYSEADLEIIDKCIMATQVPQKPGEFKLAQIMCDADLGHLGTDTYFLNTEGLRLELNRVKKLNLGVVAWHKSNINFLNQHHYFTESAKKMFQETKDKNVKLTEELVGISSATTASH